MRERSAGPNIIETKRTVLTKVDNNTTKKTVVTEQFAKVTTRDRKRPIKNTEIDTIENFKITGEGERKHAQVLNDVLRHMSGKDFDTMARTLARLIDKSGPDFAVLLTKYSTEIQQNFKMSPEQTAALISGTGTSDETWAKYRRAFNKTFGFNNIASAKKVKLARRENLPIERNDWEE